MVRVRTMFASSLVVVPFVVATVAAQAPKPGAKPAPPPKAAPARKPASPAPAPPAQQPAPAPAPAPPPDLVITASYSSGDRKTVSTLSLKGPRARIDYGNGLVTLQDCGAGRSVQMNEKTQTVLQPEAPPSVEAQLAERKKGGRITYTTTVAEAGETKEIFGFTARRLKTTMVKEASPEACNRTPERVETDGWYIELPEGLTCTALPSPTTIVRVDPQEPACRDEVVYVAAAGPAAGYPVSYTMSASAGDQAPGVTTMEVTELRREEIPPARFEVPAEYLQVRTVSQLTADHRPGEVGPKKPGVPRIGVAPVANETDQTVSLAALSEALAESLGLAEVDAVALGGTTAAAIDEEAVAKECDFVLASTVTELRRPGRGALGRLAGGSRDELSARVDFALTPPGAAKPVFSASERSGTSTLQAAIGAAKRVARFVTPLMLAQYRLMDTFAALSAGESPGALGQSSDPVLNSVSALIDRATRPRAADVYTSEDSAVAAAMEKQVSTVVEELAKRRK